MEQDTIRVRRLELVDEAGTPRALLQADSQGVSGLIVHDAGGTGTSASIGLDNQGTPFLLLSRGQNEARVFAGLTPDGPEVRVIDENGEEAALRV
jgi:hypothetical protein